MNDFLELHVYGPVRNANGTATTDAVPLLLRLSDIQSITGWAPYCSVLMKDGTAHDVRESYRAIRSALSQLAGVTNV